MALTRAAVCSGGGTETHLEFPEEPVRREEVEAGYS